MRRHTRPPSALPTLCQAHTHSAHSIPAIGPGRHARMRVHTHTAPHAGMSHEADGHEGSSSGGSSDGGNGAPFEDMPGGEPRTSRGKRASGHSRGRPLHHARLALHRKRRHGDRTVSAPRECTAQVTARSKQPPQRMHQQLWWPPYRQQLPRLHSRAQEQPCPAASLADRLVCRPSHRQAAEFQCSSRMHVDDERCSARA